MKNILPIAAAVLAALSFTPPALVASEVLEFDDVVLFGGSLTYGGATGTDPLVGTDIVFDQVTGIGTTPSGPLAITGGKLNFTTGVNLTEGATVYTFAGGPATTFVLTGTVIKPDLSVVASGVLLTGHFVGESVVLGLGGGNGLFSGVGIDTKNQDLLDYYGIDAIHFDFAHTDIGFAPAGLEADGGFVASVSDADLINTASLPDGGNVLALAGLGLIGLGIAKRFVK